MFRLLSDEPWQRFGSFGSFRFPSKSLPIVRADPFSKLEVSLRVWEFNTVKTLIVDDHKRVRIPDAKPRQVFAYENHGNGHVTLTLATAVEPFPKGSLRKYITEESNEELFVLARSSSLQLPE